MDQPGTMAEKDAARHRNGELLQHLSGAGVLNVGQQVSGGHHCPQGQAVDQESADSGQNVGQVLLVVQARGLLRPVVARLHNPYMGKTILPEDRG